MKAGPKAAALLDPLPGAEGLGPAEWIERFVIVPRGHGALSPLKLAEFQRDILDGIYAGGTRQALVSIARGNGKTSLLAAVALFEAFQGEWSAEVCVVAPTERQARGLLEQCRRMIELAPELSARCQVYAGRILVPFRDSKVVALPATPERIQGLDPSLVIVDELSEVAPATFEAVDLALGKRPSSRLVAISTPGGDRDGPMWRMVEHARQNPGGTVWLREFAADVGCALDDEEQWRKANPAIGAGFLDPAAIRSNLVTARTDSFRCYRLGQWVGAAGSWLPWGMWAPLARDRMLEPGERIVLGFDGSASGDSTALVACTLDADPFVAVVGCWEHPPEDPRWRVPRAEVIDTIREAMGRYDVARMMADPFGWRTELEELADEFPRQVVEWPTNVIRRIAGATDRTYSLIAEGRLTHDGDADLARHVGNVVAKRTAQGDVPVKGGKGHSSPKKIDLAVAMIAAVEGAADVRNGPKAKTGVWVYG